MSMAVDSLKLWIEKTKSSGDFDVEAYEKIMASK